MLQLFLCHSCVSPCSTVRAGLISFDATWRRRGADGPGDRFPSTLASAPAAGRAAIMSYSPIAAQRSSLDDAIPLRALAGPSHLDPTSSLRPDPPSPEQLRRSPSPRHVRPPGYSEGESDDDDEIQQLMDDLDTSADDETASGREKRRREGEDDDEEAGLFREDEVDSAVAIVRKVRCHSSTPRARNAR